MGKARYSRYSRQALVLGLCAVLIYAITLINQKWSRTAMAIQRVEVIHQTILKWQAQSYETGRHNPHEAIPVPEGPEDLAALDPQTAIWLREGDRHYEYSFSGLRFDNGVIYPLVSATAREAEQVYGEVVISGQDGAGSIGRVSETGRRLNLAGFSKDHPLLAILFVALLISLALLAAVQTSTAAKG